MYVLAHEGRMSVAAMAHKKNGNTHTHTHRTSQKPLHNASTKFEFLERFYHLECMNDCYYGQFHQPLYCMP